MDEKNLRKEYLKKKLSRNELKASPFDQFRKWFADALEEQVIEVNAFALATATVEGKPSCRMVLMKHFDESGIIFFTNYASRKAHEVTENPQASALFFWKELERQIAIEGKVEPVSEEESKAYFSKRPRGSQLSTWASHQSTEIPSRDYLEQKYVYFDNLYKDQEVPLPHFWGGFRLIPYRFEFWQGRQDRLHDRFSYVEENQVWKISRVSP